MSSMLIFYAANTCVLFQIYDRVGRACPVENEEFEIIESRFCFSIGHEFYVSLSVCLYVDLRFLLKGTTVPCSCIEVHTVSARHFFNFFLVTLFSLDFRSPNTTVHASFFHRCDVLQL